jgi:hypothetical protein
MQYSITDFSGRTLAVRPRLALYSVKDYFGTELPGLAVILDDVTDPTFPEQYCVLTTSFGEFIGMKNCAYIDTNNCYFAEQLCSQGLATDTGFYRTSGFCQYPLWQFEAETLKQIDDEVYRTYSEAYDSYMASMYGDEPDEVVTQEQSM